MIFSIDTLSNLRRLVKERISDKRYAHTLGVEKMARYLGEIIIPEKLDELCVAALLHDISKELSYDEQLKLLSESSVEYSKEDLSVKPALHSISAIPLVEREFSTYATPAVLSAIANHTLGESGMSVFDEIIFISDYTEEGRSYPTCQKVREYLLESISKNNSYDENLLALHSATLDAINYTIESLIKRGEQIHQKTLTTKGYYEALINK